MGGKGSASRKNSQIRTESWGREGVLVGSKVSVEIGEGCWWSCRNFSRRSDDVEGMVLELFCSQCSTNNEIRQRVLVGE